MPVAVAGYDLAVSIYEPLPRLARADDWLEFLQKATQEPARLQELGRRFRDRVRAPGNATIRIVDRIIRTIAAPERPGPAPAEIAN